MQFLKHLWLNKCGIPEAGGRALGAALARGNTTLSVLGLSNNGLGNKTAAVLGELLAGSCGLEELDLSWNQIKVTGMGGEEVGEEMQRWLEKRYRMHWGLGDGVGGRRFHCPDLSTNFAAKPLTTFDPV